MKIPISQDVSEFASPTYNQILYDVCVRGYQVISISGPRNCAKTFFEILLVLKLIEDISDLVVVIVMKEYANISKTVVPTIKEICKHDLKSDKNPWTFKGSERRPEAMEFDNGAIIHFIGASEDGRKVRGLAADVVLYCQIEAEDYDTSFREIMGTQAGGRRGNLKLHGTDTFLFIGDANPASKKHWWYRARENEIDGWYDIKHKDHPLFFDWKIDEWKPKGIQTRADLERLYPPGHWYDRMVDGLWVISEGACFTEFDEHTHVVPMNKDDFGADTKWRISVDFGNTTAAGLYAETLDGVNRLFKEYYKLDPSPTRLVEYFDYWHKTYDVPKDDIYKVITDIETGNRAVIQEADYYPEVADKTVPITAGIQILQRMLRDKKFLINKDSLDHPEQLLEGKIRCLVDEFPEIHYPPESKQTGTKRDDQPDQSCIRHAADHARYCSVDVYTEWDVDLPAILGKVNMYPKKEAFI